MKVYAESSAVLSWLFDEPQGAAVRRILKNAEAVYCSELTIMEAERAIRRGEALDMMYEVQAAELRAVLAAAMAPWNKLKVMDEVVRRSGRAFPIEPVRALDAIHLSSALLAAEHAAGLRFLTLDKRVKANAEALGFATAP